MVLDRRTRAIGIVFGWFYLRTGILAHAMANGLNILSTMIPLDIPGLTGTPDNLKEVFQPWWLDLCGLGMLMVGVWAFLGVTPKIQAQPVASPPIPPEIVDHRAKTEAGTRARITSEPPVGS